ncbi:hypothetical protein SEUCBS139899_008407 [Sporothrix eucalyptigena]
MCEITCHLFRECCHHHRTLQLCKAKEEKRLQQYEQCCRRLEHLEKQARGVWNCFCSSSYDSDPNLRPLLRPATQFTFTTREPSKAITQYSCRASKTTIKTSTHWSACPNCSRSPIDTSRVSRFKTKPPVSKPPVDRRKTLPQIPKPPPQLPKYRPPHARSQIPQAHPPRYYPGNPKILTDPGHQGNSPRTLHTMGFFSLPSRSSSREPKPPSSSHTSSSSNYCSPSASASGPWYARPSTSSQLSDPSFSFASRLAAMGQSDSPLTSFSSRRAPSSSSRPPMSSSRPSSSTRSMTSSSLKRTNATVQSYSAGHFARRVQQTPMLSPIPSSSSSSSRSGSSLPRQQMLPRLHRENTCLQDISSYDMTSFDMHGYGQQAFTPASIPRAAYSSHNYASQHSKVAPPPPPGYTYDTSYMTPSNYTSSLQMMVAPQMSSSRYPLSSLRTPSARVRPSTSSGLSSSFRSRPPLSVSTHDSSHGFYGTSLSRQASTRYSPSPYDVSMAQQLAPTDHFTQMSASYEQPRPVSRDSNGISPLSDTFPSYVHHQVSSLSGSRRHRHR